MQQTTDHPTTAPESGLAAAALRAEAWAGEAFLQNGDGAAALEELEPDEEDDEPDELPAEEADELVHAGPDPGAVRRYRFRHPTASGKTIAAAGFVDAARSLGVLILTHRRL